MKIEHLSAEHRCKKCKTPLQHNEIEEGMWETPYKLGRQELLEEIKRYINHLVEINKTQIIINYSKDVEVVLNFILSKLKEMENENL